jgi:mRNA interferase HigB
MRIIAASRIREYGRQHPQANDALMSFLKIARAAEWASIQELRKTYPHADAVHVASGKVVTILNIKGNAFRLIVAMHYNRGVLYVLRFMTHAEYDRPSWKGKL